MRLFLVFAVLFLTAFNLMAFDLKIDNMTIGTYYDLKTDDLLLGGDLPLASYKNIVFVSLGLASTGQDNPIATGGLTLSLPEVARLLKWDWLASDNIRFGAFIGKDFSMHEIHYGYYGNVVIKFGK